MADGGYRGGPGDPERERAFLIIQTALGGVPLASAIGALAHSLAFPDCAAASAVPMTYYHATTADRLPSILSNGLGGNGARARWPSIEAGVYLAEVPEHAVYVLLDWFMQAADDAASPAAFVESMRVIVIDDARVPRAKLGPDPDIPRDGIWLYRGVIDVRNMPIVSALDFAAEWQKKGDDIGGAA